MDEIFEYYLKIFAITFSIGLFIRMYINYKAKYFVRKGLQAYPSYPIVGCLGSSFLKRESLPDLVNKIYNELKQYKIAGVYDGIKPAYIVCDPDMLRQILIKDFDHFVDRLRTIPSESGSIFGKNLMSLSGNKWHTVRATLSPAFTASKMKIMLSLISECGDQLVAFLRKSCKIHDDTVGGILSLEMKDIWSRFAADVIATVAYGVKCDSLKNPDNSFLECGRSLTYIGLLRGLAFLGYSSFPKLMKMLGIPLLDPKAEKYFTTLITETLRQREEQNIVRPDMLHLLMQARKGNLKCDANEEDEYHSKAHKPDFELTNDHIMGQAVIFFFAGFDTVSSVLSFTSYFLAIHPEVQSKVQSEIDSILEIQNNKVTYEGLRKMKYLHMVISETLRLCAIPQVDRVCVKDYIIPATDCSPEVHIRKGEGIWIPIFALHRDPDYFPDPEKFEPERFNEENIHRIKPFTYLPFGMGPRNCIGIRFALMEVKIALVYLLHNFNLCRVKETPDEVKFCKKSFNLNLEGGCWIGIQPRQESSPS